MKHIMIVDDDKRVNNNLKHILSKKGYNITSVYNSSDAINLLKTSQYDLIITDMSIDNDEEAGLLILEKTKSISPLTNIIVNTAFASIQNAVKAIKNGAYEYIEKESESAIEDLVQTIQDVFSGQPAKQNRSENNLKKEKSNEETELLIKRIELKGIGPSNQFIFEPSNRLNLIMGDNGLGKTFLLECLWYVLSGKWPGFPAYPRDDAEEVSISFELLLSNDSESFSSKIHYDMLTKKWPKILKNEKMDSFVLYSRYDGSFAIYDPVKSYIRPLMLTRNEIWNGTYEKDKKKWLCNGLVSDWIEWQNTPDSSPFYIFVKILERLSPGHMEALTPGKPVRLPGDSRKIPTLKYPYGNVPIVHTAASIQRIVSLAYLLVWAWEEHKIECSLSKISPNKKMTVLIDEIESHLHPKWQRAIIPSLLDINSFLSPELNIQFIIATHSPLILASIEPFFQLHNDKLFHFGYSYPENSISEVILEEAPFLQFGRVDNWYTSDYFGLTHARSIEAEKAIQEAEDIQERKEPDFDEVKNIHTKLEKYLGDHDTFWARWSYFAENIAEKYGEIL